MIMVRLMRLFFVSILFLACFRGFGQAQFKLPGNVSFTPTVAVDSVVYKWNSVNTKTVLSDTDKEFFYWLNYSRSNPKRFYDSIVAPILVAYPSLKQDGYAASLQKDLYASPNLTMLRLNDTLVRTAKAHLVDLLNNKPRISHNSSDGTTMAERLQKAGINTCGSENIGFGPGGPVFCLALLYIDLGVPSVGHRKSLLNPQFESVGIATGPYQDKVMLSVTDFACHQD